MQPIQRIVEYQLSWHLQLGCRFRVRFENGAWPAEWGTVSAADLSALASIFNEKLVYFDPNSGFIFTGLGIPGT